METLTSHLIPIEAVIKASHRLRSVATKTPLQRCHRLSEQLGANIYLKR